MDNLLPRAGDAQLAMFPFPERPAAYPDLPGHRGVDTSATAADALAPSLGRLQRLTLEAITDAGAKGLTTHELAEATGLPCETVQPRTSELREKRLIVDSRSRRPNPSGKAAIVWTIPQFRGISS